MGASESTAKTNGTTEDDEEKSQQESGGSSMGRGKAAVALAVTGVAAVGVAAWGISRMLSENIDNQQKDGDHGMEYPVKSGDEGNGKRSIWFPPPATRRFKINTDGRCHSVPGRSNECPQEVPDDDRVQRRDSGYGGILRDHRGNWVRGFRGYIGVTDSFTAELHGIHKGLELLDEFGYNGAILETDCKAAVTWINEKDSNTSKSKIIQYSWDIIEDCKRLASKNNTIINHIKGKDANQCAHKLADLAIIDKKDEQYVEIENHSQLPDAVKRLVDEDAKPYV